TSPWEHCVYTFYIEGLSRVACYDEETEVLTREGWMRFEHVDLSTEVACMESGALEWCRPKAKIIELYRGPMVRLRLEKGELLVTPEHRLWVRDEDTKTWVLVEASNLEPGSYGIKTSLGSGRPGDSLEPDVVVRVENVELVYYAGRVYSLVVPGHLLYVRRGDLVLWSGNSHQLVRHRLASYTQHSQRYRALDEELLKPVVPPSVIKRSEAAEEFEAAYARALEAYRRLLKIGVPPEDARYVVPQAVATKIIVTMNARELAHFLSLRTCAKTQWELRALAWLMWRRLYDAHPLLWKWIGPRCLQLENLARNEPITVADLVGEDLLSMLGVDIRASGSRPHIVAERCPELVPRDFVRECARRGLEEALSYLRASASL
ncbi:MAG: FAD-dependent thymidylate synthase, partial [Fervidicoccaceae archaeon]